MNLKTMVSIACLLIASKTAETAVTDDSAPDPEFLEWLGQALELEQLGIDVDRLIEERQNEQGDVDTEESKP